MTIPASRIVNVNPGVVSTGGNSLAMNGLFLTENVQMPTDTVLSFASTAAVSKFFGPSSAEAALAAIYFAGFDKSTIKPGAMLFAAYNAAARPAFLQSGSLAAITLAQLQAFAAGVLSVTINGSLKTSASIDLSAATSFTDAASRIQAGFTSPGFTVAWNAVESAFVFTSTLTGTAATLTFASGSSLATSLKLTQVTGAFLSQGAAGDTPATAMANVIANSQNWAAFTTVFEPSLTDKEGLAAWAAAQNSRYLYVAWDSDVNASVSGNTTCFGAVAKANEYNGVMAVSGDPALATAQGTTLAALALNLGTFVLGAIASIDFTKANGRTTVAFLTSSVISATCANDDAAQALLANGYSFYGSYATANQGFIFLYNGQMPGEWLWADSFVNQIYLNSQFQLALMSLLTQVGDVSYTPSGYGLIRAAMQDPINAALSFGSIRTGVTLSAAQIAEVNQAAGIDAASVIQTEGYYLQILDPGAQARAARQSPIINFWYADGGAVQQISLASIDIL